MLKAAAPRRWPRVLAFTAAGLVVLLAAVAFAVAWYFAGVAVAVTHGVDRPLVAPSPAGPGAVRLSGSDLTEASRPGTYGLDLAGGYGALGAIESRGADGVVRAFTSRNGTVTAGATARVDTYAYAGDPKSALGLDYQDVKVHDALGDFPAWYLPGSGPTWFVHVHGHDGARGESLRYLTALHRAGMPVLVPTYRNDVGAPASPDGVDHLGLTEWQDVNAAVHWALDHGAHDVVLGGWSMGGAVALQVADRSDVKDRIRALVLDSPVLDWRDVLEHQADLRGLPGRRRRSRSGPPRTASGSTSTGSTG